MILATGKRLVVQEVNLQKEEPKSLLIIPRDKDHVHAQIVAIGNEVDQKLCAGDIVILQHSTGLQIKIDDTEYLSIADNQILAILRDE